MQRVVSRLWCAEDGAIVSAEIMLVASILVIGVIVGLKSVRDSVVTELADVAQALGNVNQSYSYSGASGHHAFTAGGLFHDTTDFCDTSDPFHGGVCEQNSKCVLICQAVSIPGCNGNGDGALSP